MPSIRAIAISLVATIGDNLSFGNLESIDEYEVVEGV